MTGAGIDGAAAAALHGKLGASSTTTLHVVVDARCLQDLAFRYRGIGQHTAVLLEGARRFAPAGVSIRLIAGIDRTLLSLAPEHRTLFDAEQSLARAVDADTLFIQASPMTHSPELIEQTLSRPRQSSVAVVYDFIPLDDPGRYLGDATRRLSYLQCLQALADYGSYVSISSFTGERLQAVLGIAADRCHVSGVAVRDALIGRGEATATDPAFCLAVLGDDPRKNAELAIMAHARSNALQQAGVRLTIVGHYEEANRERLLRLCADQGGEPQLLEFVSGISDSELAALYGQALVTICPSRAEGFSIPVIEANANQCPVIIADCAAQVELMPLTEFQFGPDDVARASSLLEAFLDPDFAGRAFAKQGQFWLGFRPEDVQRRFWQAAYAVVGLDATAEAIGTPHLHRGIKPRIAVISPVRPDRSGVADYTASTMAALAKRAHVDLYTETKGRLNQPWATSIQPLSTSAYLRKDLDATLSVVGNNSLHLSTFNLLLNYGGVAIAHDARMLHFYWGLLPAERTLDVASRELGRPASWEEIQSWFGSQRTMPILFLSEILEAASRTFVHSAATRSIVQQKYGVDTTYLPFALLRTMLPEFSGPAGRARARERLGYGANDKLIISLGDIIEDKAPEESIWTLMMLKTWGINAKLALVGKGDPHLIAYLRSISGILGVADQVYISDGAADERTFQAFLSAADVGIQLRTYGFGQLSGVLMDQAAAGLPVVTNESLAEAIGAPSYVRRIPNGLSSVLAAEQVAAIFESGGRDGNEEERLQFNADHSVDLYAKGLLEGLGLT